MNSSARVMYVIAILGCVPFSSYSMATLDPREDALVCSEQGETDPETQIIVQRFEKLKIILEKKQNLVSIWKSRLIELEDSQGRPIDMIQFIKSIESYLLEYHELDQNIVTIQNVNRALRAIEGL